MVACARQNAEDDAARPRDPDTRLAQHLLVIGILVLRLRHADDYAPDDSQLQSADGRGCNFCRPSDRPSCKRFAIALTVAAACPTYASAAILRGVQNQD